MNLLYKELALAAHPTLFVFTALGCLVLVPSYPYTVIVMFGCLAPYITFQYARETNDAWYTALLPVTKREIVRGKCALIVCAQLAQLGISIPFALLRRALEIPNNPVGLDPTVAWYGCSLLLYAVFDWIFLPAFYRSGYRAGRAFLIAMPPVLLLMTALEVLVHFPALAWLDSYASADQLRQLPILAVGAAVYAGSVVLAGRIAANRFEQVNL